MTTISHQVFTFSSSDFGPWEAFERWQSEAMITHRVATLDDVARFHLTCQFVQVGPLMVSGGRFSAQTFDRTPTMIRHDGLDHYGIFVQGDGSRRFQTARSEGQLRSLDVQLYDLAQSEHSEATAGQSGTLFLPRDLIDSMVVDFSSQHGRILRSPAARVLADYVLALPEYVTAIPPSGWPGFVEATIGLVLQVIENDTNVDRVDDLYGRLLCRRIERFIDANLGAPNLSPELIAQVFGLSRSSLYRLFSHHEGVANYIRVRRLKRVWQMLADGQDTRPIGQVIEEVGFQSGSSFSRAFRAEFGCTPRDVRLAHRGEESQPAPASMTDLMRNLGKQA